MKPTVHLNPRVMKQARATQVYATVLIDLVNNNVLSRDAAESLIGAQPDIVYTGTVKAPTTATVTTDEDEE